MSKHRYQQTSQRPAHQQVSTRPVAEGEVAMDTQRVPSPATTEQSAADANAADPDRYQVQEGISDTDPLPGEPTDLPTDEDPSDEDVEEFRGFEDISTRPLRKGVGAVEAETRVIQAPLVINRSEAEQEAYDAELVPIIPRVTQQRVSINGRWYNFVKGMEQFVERSVAEHIRSKGLI